MGNIRYQRTAHRITSAVNCRPLKPSPRSICPAAPYPTGVHIPGIPPPAKFATEPSKGISVVVFQFRGSIIEGPVEQEAWHACLGSRLQGGIVKRPSISDLLLG